MRSPISLTPPVVWRWYSLLPIVLFAVTQTFFYLTLPATLGSLVTGCGVADPAGRLAWLMFKCSMSLSLPSLLVTGIYGQIAEKWGCIYTTIIPVIGQLTYLTSLFLCFVIRHYGYRNFDVYEYVIMAGAICCGIGGARSTFLMSMFTVASYASADDSDRRSQLFSQLDASLWASSIFGPILVTMSLKLIAKSSMMVLVLCNIVIGMLTLLAVAALVPRNYQNLVKRAEELDEYDNVSIADMTSDSREVTTRLFTPMPQTRLTSVTPRVPVPANQRTVQHSMLPYVSFNLPQMTEEVSRSPPKSLSRTDSRPNSASTQTPPSSSAYDASLDTEVEDVNSYDYQQQDDVHTHSSSPSPPPTPHTMAAYKGCVINNHVFSISPEHGHSQSASQLNHPVDDSRERQTFNSDSGNVVPALHLPTVSISEPEPEPIEWDPLLTFKQIINLFNDKHLMSYTPRNPTSRGFSASSNRGSRSGTAGEETTRLLNYPGPVALTPSDGIITWPRCQVLCLNYPLPYLAVTIFFLHLCSAGDGLTRVLFLKQQLNYDQSQIDAYSAISGFLVIVSIVWVPAFVRSIGLCRRCESSEDISVDPQIAERTESFSTGDYGLDPDNTRRKRGRSSSSGANDIGDIELANREKSSYTTPRKGKDSSRSFIGTVMAIHSVVLSASQKAFTLTLSDDIRWLCTSLVARAVFYSLFGMLPHMYNATRHWQSLHQQQGASEPNPLVYVLPVLPVLLLCGPAVARLKACLSKAVPIHAVADVLVAVGALEAISEAAAPFFSAIYASTVVYTDKELPATTLSSSSPTLSPSLAPSAFAHSPESQLLGSSLRLGVLAWPGLMFEILAVFCCVCLVLVLRGNRVYVNKLQDQYIDTSHLHIPALPDSKKCRQSYDTCSAGCSRMCSLCRGQSDTPRYQYEEITDGPQ
jgi:hypothetical protein